MGNRFRPFDYWMVELKEYKDLSTENKQTLIQFYDEYVNCTFKRNKRQDSLLFNDNIINQKYQAIKKDKVLFKNFRNEVIEENDKRDEAFGRYKERHYKSYVNLVHSRKESTYKQSLKKHNKLFKENIKLKERLYLKHYKDPIKPNKYKHLTSKEYIIVKTQRELNQKVNARRHDIVGRDSLDYKRKELEDYIIEHSNNRLSYIETEFLKHVKANKVISFVKEELIHLVESLCLYNSKTYLLNLRDEVLEVWGLHESKDLSKNKTYLFMKHTLEVLKVLSSNKMIDIKSEEQYVLSYLTNIYDKMIFKQSVVKKSITQHCDI